MSCKAHTCFSSEFTLLLCTNCEIDEASSANQFFTVARACWYRLVVDAAGGWEGGRVGGSSRCICDIDQLGIPSSIGRKSHHQKLHLRQAALTDSAKKDLWEEVGGDAEVVLMDGWPSWTGYTFSWKNMQVITRALKAVWVKTSSFFWAFFSCCRFGGFHVLSPVVQAWWWQFMLTFTLLLFP